MGECESNCSNAKLRLVVYCAVHLVETSEKNGVQLHLKMQFRV